LEHLWEPGIGENYSYNALVNSLYASTNFGTVSNVNGTGTFSYNGKEFSATGAFAGSAIEGDVNGFKFGGASALGGGILNSENLNLAGQFATIARWTGI
jgi:hypothetical protein